MRLRRHRRACGLTLLEMLVTLVIVSMLAGVLAQALVQLARIERLLEGGQLGALADSVRGEWVRSALASLLPGEVSRGERFEGSSRELSGLSADAPMLPDPGITRMRMRLVYNERGDLTELQFDDPQRVNLSADTRPAVLLAWPGRSGRFRYLDAQGVWQDTWSSAAGSTAPALPAAVALETGIEGLPLLVAAVRTSEVQLPSRRELEAL